jgi:uncharacterized protein
MYRSNQRPPNLADHPVKIIDTHTHLPGHTFGGTPRPIADLRREFTAAGLDGAWLFTTDGLLCEPERNNDTLAEAVQHDRDFFVPFCTVSPHAGEQKAIRELERARDELGMRGVKFHPWLQAFSMMNPAMESIMRRAGELGLPVVFHDGTPPYSSPLQIAALAERVPETTVILGHAGLDDLYEDAILACRRQPNVYLCLCCPSSGYMAQVIRRCPVERLLFGSDGGFAPHFIDMAVAKLQATGVAEAILRKICYENPRKLLPDNQA